jgi:Spy/CpxP family protein refolding chaperone
MIRRSVALLAMLALTGTALAQSSPPPAPQWHGHHPWKDAAQWRQKMEQRRMDRLALLLDLTPAQRQQVQAIFSDERAKMKPAMQQVLQAMKQAHAAHEAVRKETQQRLASVLSPTQMKKLKALMPGRGMMMHGMMMHGMDHGMDHGMGPPPGEGPGPQ